MYRPCENSPCQLIETIYNSNLLDLDLLRQNEIWFVERQKNHSSNVYFLNKFKERSNKEHLLERCGGMTLFNNSFLNEEEVYDQ